MVGWSWFGRAVGCMVDFAIGCFDDPVGPAGPAVGLVGEAGFEIVSGFVVGQNNFHPLRSEWRELGSWVDWSDGRQGR